MRLSFVAAVERSFSDGFRARLLPLATALDATLHDRDDRSVSRRIAIVAFSVRVVSAFIAYISPGAARPLDGRFRVRRLRRRLGRRGDPRRARLPRLPDGDRALRAGVYRARREGASARRRSSAAASTASSPRPRFAVIGGLGLYAFGDHLASYYLIPLYLGAVTLPMLASARSRTACRAPSAGRTSACGRPTSSGRCSSSPSWRGAIAARLGARRRHRDGRRDRRHLSHHHRSARRARAPHPQGGAVRAAPVQDHGSGSASRCRSSSSRASSTSSPMSTSSSSAT